MTVAKDRADWLLDAIACSTQDRRFLRGDPQYDEVAGEAILICAEKAIQTAINMELAHTEVPDVASQRLEDRDQVSSGTGPLKIPDECEQPGMCRKYGRCLQRGCPAYWIKVRA